MTSDGLFLFFFTTLDHPTRHAQPWRGTGFIVDVSTLSLTRSYSLAFSSSPSSSFPFYSRYFFYLSQAILGVDIVCQAKSGMGKTAVFVLATLHQLNPQSGEVSFPKRGARTVFCS